MSKKGIDQDAIEEFFNENPNVFSSVLRNMKGKTKKSYKKLPSINQTRKTNRDYKKKKKLSPIKEGEEEKEKSKEKVCFGCLQSGGMEDNKKRQRTGSFETFMDRHPIAMPLPRGRPEVVIPLPEEGSQADRQARQDRMMLPGPLGDPTHMTRISRNPPTTATAARVLDPSDLSNYYRDPNDERIDRYNWRQNNLKYRIAVQNYYSNPDNPFPKNIREWRQIINDLAIRVRDDENDSENNHLLNALRKVRPSFTGRRRDYVTFETRDDFLNNNRRQIEIERSFAIIDDVELKRLGFQVVPNSAHIGGKTKKRRKSSNKHIKTNKKKSRRAGGPPSIFSSKKHDTFGLEGSAVREPTEEEKYPFEEGERYHVKGRKPKEIVVDMNFGPLERGFIVPDDDPYGDGPFLEFDGQYNRVVPKRHIGNWPLKKNVELANAYNENAEIIKHKKNIEHNKHVVTNPLHQYKK